MDFKGKDKYKNIETQLDRNLLPSNKLDSAQTSKTVERSRFMQRLDNVEPSGVVQCSTPAAATELSKVITSKSKKGDIKSGPPFCLIKQRAKDMGIKTCAHTDLGKVAAAEQDSKKEELKSGSCLVKDE